MIHGNALYVACSQGGKNTALNLCRRTLLSPLIQCCSTSCPKSFAVNTTIHVEHCIHGNALCVACRQIALFSLRGIRTNIRSSLV